MSRPSLKALSKNVPRITAIDLFCGAGGLTYGLQEGGIRVAAGIDIDPASKFAFESNNPGAQFILERVENITKKHLESYWADASERLLAGCAPCQPFSTYSQGKSLNDDSRWRLLGEFTRLVIETMPDHVTMENVPSLRKNEVFDNFINTLHSLGYQVWKNIVDCTTLGLPQARQRLVLLASKNRAKPLRLRAGSSECKTVRATIEELKPLKAGETDPDDSMHRCAKLSAQNLRRIRASQQGGTWRDWPAKLRCDCHKRASGDGYQAVYGRMCWDDAAPTITTQCYNYGSGRFGHPVQDRAISLREAALLQGFPKNYLFEPEDEKMTTRDLSRLIGNAVPPPLGAAIAQAFKAVHATNHEH